MRLWLWASGSTFPNKQNSQFLRQHHSRSRGSGCDRVQLLAQCLQMWGELWNRFRLGGGVRTPVEFGSEYLAESLDDRPTGAS